MCVLIFLFLILIFIKTKIFFVFYSKKIGASQGAGGGATAHCRILVHAACALSRYHVLLGQGSSLLRNLLGYFTCDRFRSTNYYFRSFTSLALVTLRTLLILLTMASRACSMCTPSLPFYREHSLYTTYSIGNTFYTPCMLH